MIKFLPYNIFVNQKELLKEKKVHFVCQADISDHSTVETYRSTVFNKSMDRADLLNYISITNNKKEASTLYPKYYLSLYPKLNLETETVFRNHFKTFFKDLIILANEKYLRSDSIFFIFEKEHLAYQNIIIELINDLLGENEDVIIYTRNIYLTSVNNLGSSLFTTNIDSLNISSLLKEVEDIFDDYLKVNIDSDKLLTSKHNLFFKNINSTDQHNLAEEYEEEILFLKSLFFDSILSYLDKDFIKFNSLKSELEIYFNYPDSFENVESLEDCILISEYFKLLNRYTGFEDENFEY